MQTLPDLGPTGFEGDPQTPFITIQKPLTPERQTQTHLGLSKAQGGVYAQPRGHLLQEAFPACPSLSGSSISVPFWLQFSAHFWNPYTTSSPLSYPPTELGPPCNR